MMQAYLEGKREASNLGSLVTILALLFGILGIVIAYGAAFGWIPFGEREQILRSDINTIERIVTVISLLYAACCLRTAYGLYTREQASLRWSQWMMFTSVMIGGAILLSVAIPVGLKFSLLLGQVDDLRTLISQDAGGVAAVALSVGEGLISICLFIVALLALLALLVFLIPPLEPLRERPGTRWIVSPPRKFIQAILAVLGIGVICFLVAGAAVVPDYPGQTTIRDAENHRLIAGLLFFLPAFFVYRVVRQVEEQSDELRRAVALTPGKFIRAELAKSPSAGAIIGFVAIFMGFTMATDLFLEPSSVASFLSNVATKGVIAIGVTYLMISGEFDLSVGSILGRYRALVYELHDTRRARIWRGRPGAGGPARYFYRLHPGRYQRRPPDINANTVLYCHAGDNAGFSRHNAGRHRRRPHLALQRSSRSAAGDRHQQHRIHHTGCYRPGGRRLHRVSRLAGAVPGRDARLVHTNGQ